MVWSHKCWNNKGSIPHHEILYFIFNFKNKSILSKWSILWKIHKIKVYRLMNCHKKNRSCNQQSQEMKHHQHIRNTLWASPTLSLYPTSPQVTTILLSNINNYFCLFLNFICKKSYHLDHLGLSLSFRFLMWDSFMLLHVACYAFYWGLFRLCSGLGIMNHSVKSLVLKKTFWHITACYIPWRESLGSWHMRRFRYCQTVFQSYHTSLYSHQHSSWLLSFSPSTAVI